jgi:uncharacterized protein (DUF1330 family)
MGEGDGPVMMIVLATVSNPAKLGAYSKALAESGLYEKHQGYYAGIGRPVDSFEGAWGETEALVVARFPSLEAARSFWFSDAYQNKIKPLREGAGDFRVVVLPASPKPERIDWE